MSVRSPGLKDCDLLLAAIVACCVVVPGCADQATGAKFVHQVPWIGKGQWIKADTHVHSRFSDGGHSVDEVVSRSVGFGVDYLAITDHSDANLKAGTAEYVEAIQIARRQFPQTIIAAGLEWNIPPWGGNEHATVLIPPTNDELRLLGDFKSNFDDLGRGRQTPETADSALRWLASNAESNGVRPIVIYNHPNRKSDSTEEIAPRMEHWRNQSDLVIGMEGAPGHQRATPLGAYKNRVQPIDRWDPAVAEVGGAWDLVLKSGFDVWGALAPSDFHSESTGDYWPGEFSETWLYVPERSAAGALQALRAGTFFGSHGHIVREASLEILAPGLSRSAVPGDVIEAPASSAIQAQVRFVVPERDWKGEHHEIDQVELIVVDAQGARIAAQNKPSASGVPLSADLIVPDGGLVLRARGRRIVTDGPDLLFYTNPVRVITASSSNWFSRSGTDTGSGSGRQGSEGKSPLPLARVLGGLAMLVLTLAVVFLALRRPRLQPAQVVVVDQGRPIIPLSGGYYLAAAGIVIAFAAYGSLIPLQLRPYTFNDAWLDFQKVISTGVHFRSRSDVLVNVVLFVPIGALALAGVTVGRPTSLIKLFAVPLVMSISLMISCAIEFGQFWVQTRIPAINDIAAQFIGTTIGILVWLAFGRRLHTWLSALAGAQQRQERMDRLLQLYATGLFLYGLFPLDVVTSTAELWHKFRDGKVRLRPFMAWEWNWFTFLATLTDVALFVPIGALATRVFAGWASGLRPIAPSVLLSVLFAGMIEGCQLFISSRYTKVDDVITAAIGASIGAWWMHRYHSRQAQNVSEQSEIGSAPAWMWFVSSAVYSGFLVVIFCQPFEPVKNSTEIALRWQNFFAVPFSSVQSGNDTAAVTQILRKLLWFGPLGALALMASRSWTRSRMRRRRMFMLLFSAVFLLAVGIELLQLTLADHTPDLTDALACIVGAILGVTVTAFILSGATDDSELKAQQSRLVFRSRAHKRGWRRILRHRFVWNVSIGGFLLLGIWSLFDFDNGFQGPAGNQGGKFELPKPTRIVIFDEQQLSGVRFGAEPIRTDAAPLVSRLGIPEFSGANAIWGATGRDARGHIWFGVSAAGVDSPSAHLFEFVPGSNQVIDRGDVLSELKKCGRFQDGMRQSKIHSKIVQGGDGHLYFASMDEQGESEDGSCLPTWGGNLWRLRLPEYAWEHLVSVPEALIAVAGYGDQIYALGYFGHVLYRLNTTTGEVGSVRVGSDGGHVSRNLICDSRGHAFVPRLEKSSGTAEMSSASVIEFDPTLRELARTPLNHYLHGTPVESHGIVGVQPMADWSIVFVTHAGFLYRIYSEGREIPAVVREIGWFHAEGAAYVPSLFTFGGKRYVTGISHHLHGKVGKYEWLLYDLETQTSKVLPFEVPSDVRTFSNLLLYGCTTRDDAGNFYLSGTYTDKSIKREIPIVVRVRPDQ